jgi:uncharacterized protein (DUF1501 family)
VIFLDGGNDGVNMVVPHRDEGYARNRQALRLKPAQLIKITDELGLHPAMYAAGKLIESGRLAIVPGVGYPNTSYSHFRSALIWQSARLEEPEQEIHGWLGRSLDATRKAERDPAAGDAQSVFIGTDDTPLALRGKRAVTLTMRAPEDLMLDPTLPAAPAAVTARGDDLSGFVGGQIASARTAAEVIAQLGRRAEGAAYPATALGQRLRVVAKLIQAELGPRIYYTTQSGYDTHSFQLPTHQLLLKELGDGLSAFQNDLTAARIADRVCLLVFSEFGRRVRENASGGTDHGAAGPVLLAGSKVKAGICGEYPSLTDLEGGNLKWKVDFRRVYATVLESWLGVPSREVLGGEFEPLDVLRA